MVDKSLQSSAVLNADPVIRAMTVRDLPAAAELSVEQQWPHRVEDWELFLKLGEGVVAERNGKLIGTALGWCFGPDMATVGMVIVNPAEQGQGIGRKLMDAIIARLGDRTIVLNATEEGLPLYKKLGFVEIGRVYQHQGLVKDVPLAELPPGNRIRPKGKADTNLADSYGAASGMDRQALFETLAQESRSVVYTQNNVPAGFAMLRRFGRGWAIGPVVASDQASAKALVLHWLAVKQGSFCRIDVTADGGLSNWIEEIGLPCVGSVRTMARGPAPVCTASTKVFALTAQALG